MDSPLLLTAFIKNNCINSFLKLAILNTTGFNLIMWLYISVRSAGCKTIKNNLTTNVIQLIAHIFFL